MHRLLFILLLLGTAYGQQPVLPAAANAAAPTYTEGNQVSLSTDLKGALRQLPQDRTATGSITAISQTVTIDVTAMNSVVVDVTGNWTGTLGYLLDSESTTNINAGMFRETASNWVVQSIGAGGNQGDGTFFVNVSGFKTFHVDSTLWTSGTATVKIRATTAWFPSDLMFQGILTTGGVMPPGDLIYGVATTAAPSYTTNTTNPISQTAAGALRADVSSIGGNTVSTGIGVTGTGVQRVNDTASGTTGSAVPAQAGYAAGNGTGNLTGFLRCDNSAVYDTSTNGKTQLVALSSGKVIYVCGVSISQSTTSTVTVSLGSGTGANCGTTYTAKTPAWPLQAPASVGPVGMVLPVANVPWFQTAASEELCLSTNAAVSLQVLVVYTQF